MRFLIVDDEPIIAMELATLAEEAGFAATVVNSIDAALAEIARTACNAAVLDANLRGNSAAPIARRLRASGLPFIVITGYAADQLGDWVGDAPVIAKPFDVKIVIAELSKLAQAARVDRCAAT